MLIVVLLALKVGSKAIPVPEEPSEKTVVSLRKKTEAAGEPVEVL